MIKLSGNYINLSKNFKKFMKNFNKKSPLIKTDFSSYEKNKDLDLQIVSKVILNDSYDLINRNPKFIDVALYKLFTNLYMKLIKETQISPNNIFDRCIVVTGVFFDKEASNENNSFKAPKIICDYQLMPIITEI